jgi:hypothetical protein
MENIIQVSAEILDLLRHTDTCTFSNAIEAFNVRMRMKVTFRVRPPACFPNCRRLRVMR